MRIAFALAAAAAVFALSASSAPGHTASIAFSAPQYVDQQLAGGEPEVIADPLHGDLVYTSHEGTTHLYRDGIVNSPWATSPSSRTTATR